MLDSKHRSVRGKKITTSSGDFLSRAKLTRTQRCILPSERACDDSPTIKVKRQMTDSRVKEEEQLEGGDVGHRWKYKQCDTFTKQCDLSSYGGPSFEFRALIRRTNEPKWICFNELACLYPLLAIRHNYTISSITFNHLTITKQIKNWLLSLNSLRLTLKSTLSIIKPDCWSSRIKCNRIDSVTRHCEWND